jgi:hypothetical protein
MISVEELSIPGVSELLTNAFKSAPNINTLLKVLFKFMYNQYLLIGGKFPICAQIDISVGFIQPSQWVMA